MSSVVSEQFQQATVDFYSALGEGELGLAAEVGDAMRAMVRDGVLDSVEDEMARDCLAKLGKAGQAAVVLVTNHRQGIDLAAINRAAVACAVAGPPFDTHAAKKFSAVVTALVDATGKECADDLTNSSSTSVPISSAGENGAIHRHLRHVGRIFAESAGHLNALSGVGFRPAVVLSAIAPLCSMCARHANAVLGLFKKHSRLPEWERFVQSGGPPPRRARKAGLLVQEVIDPILNEASSLCKEFWRFNTFATDIVRNIQAAAEAEAVAEAEADASTSDDVKAAAVPEAAAAAEPAADSLRRVQVAAQEMVVGYMMVEHYCITRNVAKAVEIAVVAHGGQDGAVAMSEHGSGVLPDGTPGTGHGASDASVAGHKLDVRTAHGNAAVADGSSRSNVDLALGGQTSSSGVATMGGKSPSLSLVGECFFILKIRFSRALNTLHVDAARFILNHLQAVLEEVVLLEVQSLMECRSVLNLAAVAVLDKTVAQSSKTRQSSHTASIFLDSKTLQANEQLSSNFNATLDLLLDDDGAAGAAVVDSGMRPPRSLDEHGRRSGRDGAAGAIGMENRKAAMCTKFPLASLLVAACSAGEAQSLCESFAFFVQAQFAGAFGADNLSSIGPMLENMAETGRAFVRIRDAALDDLAARMEDGIKHMLEHETKLLEVEYELTSETFRLRQVNDLFAHKLVAYLDSDQCLLYHCRRHMAPDDGILLVRALAGRLASLLDKVWLQMRVNSLGGLMMQNDLRILIDGLGAMMHAGSVRQEFSRLSALCWLVNLDSPDELVEPGTLAASVQKLAGLGRDDICSMLALRVDFERQPEKIKAAVLKFLEMRP